MTTTNAAFRVTRRVLGAPTVGPFLALLLAMAFFSYKSDVFLEGQNLSLVLQQVMVVGVLAIGQTFVILTAGIDLSCGTVMAFGQIVMTKLAVAEGVDPLLAIALGIAACVCFGLLNGAFVAGVGLPAFIVTLGTLNIAFALTHVYSNDETYSELPSELLFFGRFFTIGNAEITYGVPAMFVLFGIAWYALTQTTWGRHVFAVGDNLEAARLMGIKTKRVLLSVWSQASPTGSPPCCSWLARSSATRTPVRRVRTSTRSQRSSSAARVSSAGAGR